MVSESSQLDAHPKHAPSSRFDLGILVVPGVGGQKQGEVLTAWAGAIVGWIRSWLSPDVGDNASGEAKAIAGTVTFSDAAIRPLQLNRDAPASAAAQVSAGVSGGTPVTQRWLFVESWWGAQTIAPQLVPFLGWLVTRGSWILLMHLHELMGPDLGTWATRAAKDSGRQFSAFLEIVRIVLISVVWLIASCLLLVAWAVGAALAVVPFGTVRKAVTEALLRVTGSIGDSYVLTVDPLQRAAFATTTREALTWLSERCERVAVVAHSQGAVLTHEVLRDVRSPRVELFLTAGASFAKLEALRHRERGPNARDFKWSAITAPLAVAAFVVHWRLSLNGVIGVELWAPVALIGITAVGGWVVSYTSVSSTITAFRRWHFRDLLLPSRRVARWCDVYTKQDPVTNGTLKRLVPAALWAPQTGDGPKPQGSSPSRLLSTDPSALDEMELADLRASSTPMENIEVTVHASVIADHTRYFESRSDFLLRVVEELDRCTGNHILGSATLPTSLKDMKEAFQRDARWILAKRAWVSTMAALLLLACFVPWRGGLPGHVATVKTVKQLRAVLDRAPVEVISNLASTVEQYLGRSLAFVGGVDSAPMVASIQRKGLVSAFLLMLLVAGALWIWRATFAVVWRGHVSALERRAFLPASSGVKTRTLIVGRVVLAVMAALPLLISALWAFFPSLLDERSLVGALVAVCVSLLALFVGSMNVVLALLAAREMPEALRRLRIDVSGRTLRSISTYENLWLYPFTFMMFSVGGWFMLKRSDIGLHIGPYLWFLCSAFLALRALYSIRPKLRSAEVPVSWPSFAWRGLVLACGAGAFGIGWHYLDARLLEALTAGFAGVFAGWLFLHLAAAVRRPVTEPGTALVP